jgi:Group II intron, maturase-specific domain/Reverse transcriptase (RNA-dependent DNA polymerase)
VLDELDRELERRGHRFVRYADDCNIYVRSEKAGRRVMASVTRFLETRLKLRVNAAKSAVAHPWERSFLGFTLGGERDLRRCVAPKALVRFKERVTRLTRRSRGVDMARVIADLNPILRGWAGYFRFSQWGELASLDGWIRRRLRCLAWAQWKTARRRVGELERRGVARSAAFAAVESPKGPWRLSSSKAMNGAFGKARFRSLGLVSMADFVKAQSAEPPWYGPVCPVVWEGWHREVPPYPDQLPQALHGWAARLSARSRSMARVSRRQGWSALGRAGRCGALDSGGRFAAGIGFTSAAISVHCIRRSR